MSVANLFSEKSRRYEDFKEYLLSLGLTDEEYEQAIKLWCEVNDC